MGIRAAMTPRALSSEEYQDARYIAFIALKKIRESAEFGLKNKHHAEILYNNVLYSVRVFLSICDSRFSDCEKTKRRLAPPRIKLAKRCAEIKGLRD